MVHLQKASCRCGTPSWHQVSLCCPQSDAIALALQALPYCWTLLLVPMHFMTFELLLLATGMWTTNIHDTVDGKVCCGAGLYLKLATHSCMAAESLYSGQASGSQQILLCPHRQVPPLLGAGYHTIHHITYRHNFG